MYHVMPGDTLVIGGGLFRTVIAVHLSQDTQSVTLRNFLTREKEAVDWQVLCRHLEEGFVRVVRDTRS